MLMNSLWNLIDWLLPSIRLPDDLAHVYRDPEALSSVSHHHHRASIHSTHSSCNSTPSQQTRDGNPFSQAYQLASRPAIAPPSSASHEAGAGSRGGAASEWHRERDTRSGEREYREREREKERVERERQAAQQQAEKEGMLKKIRALEGQVDKLTRELRASREDNMAIQKISSKDYIPPPLSVPAVPPSDPNALRAAYDSLLSMHTHTHNTLAERTEELASLNSFLSKTDDFSGAQLIQALRDLNAEIVHLSASMADELTSPASSFAPYRFDPTTHHSSQKAKELVAGMIGVGATKWLLARQQTEDLATVLQFAIQAWEVSCVGRAMDSFCYGLPREVDQFLSLLFEQMHQTEPQPTTSRWRALTYAHTRELLASSSNPQKPPPSPFQTLSDHNARGLLSILALCNFTSLPREALLARWGAHLLRISERAERLAEVIREGVMSAGFEVMWVKPAGPGEGQRSAPFDGEWMEDVYERAGTGNAQGMGVMCTIEFGLMLVQKGASSERNSFDEPRPNEHTNGSAKAHYGMNGHGSANGHARITNGHTNGAGAHHHDETLDGENSQAAALTKKVLLRPKVLLDTVSQFV
ncbi:hypothetical protein EIP91_000430 [Steccherinum ochraceum]|uniref:Uncharacterized protein n=1 Tax=Steccherinum ochraceum TaxID=92696 RepID=A0A4R0RI67_9APHY|nr:hypothetical protein EIP91_000430 [Steccherinum ochraceum]